MEQRWQTLLAHGRTLALDGGTGSELRRRGVPLDAAVWSARAPLTHYELLRAIHLDYIAAGADVVTTSTFATARFVLEAAGHGEDFSAINAAAFAAAREARDRSGREVAIAGSISCLPPRFDVHAYPDERTESSASSSMGRRNRSRSGEGTRTAPGMGGASESGSMKRSMYSRCLRAISAA